MLVVVQTRMDQHGRDETLGRLTRERRAVGEHIVEGGGIARRRLADVVAEELPQDMPNVVDVVQALVVGLLTKVEKGLQLNVAQIDVGRRSRGRQTRMARGFRHACGEKPADASRSRFN